MIRLLDFSEAECPFSRTEAVVLLLQLQKVLREHMDLRFSYDDLTTILSPGWNLLSGVVSGQMAFLWTSPCILYMSAGIALWMEH